MMMMNMTQEIWATKDIDIDVDDYYRMSFGMFASVPGFENLFEEMKKIEGFMVRSESTTDAAGMVIKSTMELIDLAEKDAPKGTYDIPKDYKQVEMDQ